MSKNISKFNNSTMGFSGWLTILFVGLKLTGYISWPWIWVISPLWISLAILLACVILVLIFTAIISLLDN